MIRHALRSISALAFLGCALILLNVAHAQTTTSDLKPHVSNIAPDAFKRVADQGAAGNSQIVETDRLAADAQFNYIMLRWQSTEPTSSTLEIEIRASSDGTTWTDWGEAHEDHDLVDPEDPEGLHWSGVVYTGLAEFYQLRITSTPGTDGSMPGFSNVQVHTVDSRLVNMAVPQPQSDGVVSPMGVARPAYISRTGWGNPQGEAAPNAPPAYYTANHLVVHHTADSNNLGSNEPNWAARVRAIWSFHTYSRGWGDIGYNWLIDPNGVIYAGRAGSTDTTRDAVGFHDTANYGSMGVSLIGTYSSVAPTTAAQNSLVDILSWKASQRNIDPMGSSWYYGCSRSDYCAPFNSGSVVLNIAGHRQVTPGHTTCPGDQVINLLPSIRQRVHQRLNGGGGDNGDATIDEMESSFTSGGAWKDRSCGYGGHTYWTYATNGSEGIPSENWGVWKPNLPQTGQYKVLVHIPQGCAIASPPYATTNARYEIRHASGTETRIVDQNTAQEWVELGTFQFNAGTAGSVKLTDLTSEPFSAKKVVFFDAVQWVYQAPPPAQASAALLSATVKATTVGVGEVVPIEFTIKNTGTVDLLTQAPEAGASNEVAGGWVYDEAECFAGGSSYPTYPKEAERLRITLGFAGGSATVPTDCSSGDGGYPWRWGVGWALRPGETRTMIGYVRFRTPGTYTFKANLVNEFVKFYGADGNGGDRITASVTVTPERRAPEPLRIDATYKSQASVYQLVPTPDSLLARTTNAMSVVEGTFLGALTWDGSDLNWMSGGPMNQSERFVVRQVRPFYAPAAGTYRFKITSDDGAWLWVNGQEIVRNEGLHPTSSKEGSIYLSAGLHTLAVKFFENTGEAYAGYSWMPPGAAGFITVPAPSGAVYDGTRFGGGQQLVLAADDLGGVGVRTLRYWIDGGSEQQSASGRAPISLGDGAHTVTYQAEDNNGNLGFQRSVSLTVDATPPSSTLATHSQGNGIVEVYLSSTASDLTEFEVQVRDTTANVNRLYRIRERQLLFFGMSGHSYEFRVRASDGLNWSSFPSSAQSTEMIGESNYPRLLLPAVAR
ncbi:MAG TPA: N-acetylmuramoyl-L-alanine amidase [Herpetosiphonaceae bacterium]